MAWFFYLQWKNGYEKDLDDNNSIGVIIWKLCCATAWSAPTNSAAASAGSTKAAGTIERRGE
jgi:hypothetical protein